MKLKSLLDKKFIFPSAKIKSKEEALDLVLKQFSHGYKFNIPLDEIKQAILNREALGGTLLESGMAIPHARLEGFKDLLVGIVLPEKPIREPDGSEIRCLVIFLTTKTGSSLYLQTLASFARLAQDSVRMDQFTACRNEADVLQLMDTIFVKKEMTVKDIMSENLYSIHPDSSLKVLADTFYKYKISYLPVVDDKGVLIGEVDMTDLLKVGIPDYALMLGSLDFLSHFEPFEELLNMEDQLKVNQIMRKAKLTLKLDTSLIKTTLEMTKNNRRQLPVVEEGKIVGVVSYMDLLSKVLRA